MTEAEWPACTDPTPMLEFLRSKASDRKIRLFACAYCRLALDLPAQDEARRAVNTAERHADGEEDAAVLEEVAYAAAGLGVDCAGLPSPEMHRRVMAEFRSFPDFYNPDPWAVYCAAGPPRNCVDAAMQAAMARRQCLDTLRDWEESPENAALRDAGGRQAGQTWLAVLKGWAGARGRWVGADACLAPHPSRVTAVIRCLLSNLFRPATLDPAWLCWNKGAIPKLTQSIYDERAFDRLPLLADTIEDAGCADAAILSHCRNSGAHVRGKWTLSQSPRFTQKWQLVKDGLAPPNSPGGSCTMAL